MNEIYSITMDTFSITVNGRQLDVQPHIGSTFLIYEEGKLILELEASSNFDGGFYWDNQADDPDHDFDEAVGKAIEAYNPKD
jgi:hypothetical protein